MRKIAPETVDELRIHVASFPPRRNLRPFDVVAALADDLMPARVLGHSLADLVAQLAHYGINTQTATLRTYLSRAQRARRNSVTAHATASAASTSSAAPVTHLASGARAPTQSYSRTATRPSRGSHGTLQ